MRFSAKQCADEHVARTGYAERAWEREEDLRSKIISIRGLIGGLEWTIKDLRRQIAERDEKIATLQNMNDRAQGWAE